MPADCGKYAPEQYRLRAKSRADSAGNSSKAHCSLILFRTPLRNSLSTGSIIEYYRPIVKQKTSKNPFFVCVRGGGIGKSTEHTRAYSDSGQPEGAEKKDTT